MKIGISLTSGRPVTDPREGARWMIERAAAARRAGLDSLFVGDHHGTPGPYYQNVPMLGRLLAEFQGLQWKFAEMKMKLDAGQLLLYRAAANADRGFPSAEETAIAKVFCASVPQASTHL